MQITSSLANALTPTAVALGNFDGIHQGHSQVIRPVLSSPFTTAGSAVPTVVTFNPHPQEFFSGQPRCLLTPIAEKAFYLEQMGIQQLVLLPFNRELAQLTPLQFVEEILIQGLQVKQISIGQDFCFGQGRAGTAEMLQAIAEHHGITVVIAPLKLLQATRVSSSAIRQALQAGDLQAANAALGRAYSLVGEVVKGQQLGRTLGFPTANLRLPPEKFLPHQGVYAVRVQICDRAELHLTCNAQSWPGVMNLGHRPTVEGTQLIAEVHLFDWTGDLYGKTLVVNLEAFIRPEQKFNSLEQLKAQIQQDCKAAIAHLTPPPTAPSPL